MPSNKIAIETHREPVYAIWFEGGAHRGTAYKLLDEIHKSAATRSREIRKLTTDEYASALISDAAFFLPPELIEFLNAEGFESDFDRALRYLAEMQSSGVRILSKT